MVIYPAAGPVFSHAVIARRCRVILQHYAYSGVTDAHEGSSLLFLFLIESLHEHHFLYFSVYQEEKKSIHEFLYKSSEAEFMQ
jgi:hypothetical protein